MDNTFLESRNRKKIYVAGPYTSGDTAINVREAYRYADKLFDAGFLPFVPHSTHFWHILHPRSYEDWMMLDFAYLNDCDGLLRFPGESKGADREVKVALELKIPVFYSVESAEKHEW